MSYTDALARIDQLQQRLMPAASPPASIPAASGQFAGTLDTAKAATAATAATSAPAAGQGVTAGAAGPADIEQLIQDAAAKYKVSVDLVRAVVRQESGFDPSARSPAGAQGLMQLMPATARGLGVNDPSDPAQNLDGGVRYLKQQLDAFDGDVRKALAAYNAGPGAVQRYGGVPPYAETQKYVQKITAEIGL